MIGSANDTPTTRALTECVQRGRTGRLSVGVGAADLTVWLLDGQVVATRSGDETRVLVERFSRMGQLTPARARQLQAMVDHAAGDGARPAHDPIVGILSDEIDAACFERALSERFHENLCRYLGSLTTPTFVEDLPPWTENIRVDLDARSLMARCVLEWDMASALDDNRQLLVGPQSPESPEDKAAIEVARRGRCTVSDIVGAIDLEPVAAKVAVVRMIDRGVLVDPPRNPGRKAPQPWEAQPEIARRVVYYSRSGADGARGDGAAGSGLDDELDAFSGELDERRGGNNDGAFISSKTTLERVELTELPREEASSNAEPVFAAPTLSDRDAAAKIEVANDVLLNLCRSLDQAQGPGRGAATIQLLVDARPRHFALVFDSAKVSPNGQLPARVLLGNLKRRSPTEQRRLLNDCLNDLLDRALDKAADELGDDMFSQVLERVMGYRQRLGL